MQQPSLLFYRFRFLFASALTLAFLVLLSALITALGSNTVLNTKTGSSTNALDTGVLDSPNTVAVGMNSLVNGTEHVLLSTGIAFYNTCRSITGLTTKSGRGVVHGSATVVHGAGSGVAFVGRGVGSTVMFIFRSTGTGIMFAVHTPGRLVGSVASGHAVSAITRPTDDKPVPVISSETSAAALANLSAAQQQQITQLLAAQAVANRGLGGTILAGDPNHGGYPAKWDDARQDSSLDSWGMYNRECVSYAAWKVYQTYGNMPYWGGVGNANQWVRDAKHADIPTGSIPQVHSVAISMSGYYGHAMWVEKVSGDMIYVSQYNYDLHGHYSEMWVNGSHFTYIYFK